VEVSYALGNLSQPWLKMALGYFPFKYNEDAKDLANICFEAGLPNRYCHEFGIPFGS